MSEAFGVRLRVCESKVADCRRESLMPGLAQASA